MKSTTRQMAVGGSWEELLGERNLEHWPVVAGFTRGTELCAHSEGVLPSRGQLPLQGCVFSPHTPLVQPMWVLNKLPAQWPKRNTKLPVKMKALWQGLPLSLSEHGKQRTPFFWTWVTHIFPLFYYLQSWQPHKSSIQIDCERDEAPWIGCLLSSWPPSL